MQSILLVYFSFYFTLGRRYLINELELGSTHVVLKNILFNFDFKVNNMLYFVIV